MLSKIYPFDEVGSTNETILAAGERGEPEWTVHLARSQRRGRGRGSHTWWSPAGRGLWMSILLRPTVHAHGDSSGESPGLTSGRLGALALVAGVAVRAALEPLGCRGIELFWPNDLYYRRRKLGGILGEVRRGPPDVTVALGIGLNIDLEGIEPPEGLGESVAWLSETGCRERDPEALARSLLEKLEPLYRSFHDGAPVPALVGDSLCGMGREVRVKVPSRPPFLATTVGIGEEGELLIRREGNIQPLRVAEIDYDLHR